MYDRTMDRLWRGTLLLGLGIFAVWWFGGNLTTYYRPQIDPILLGAAGFMTAFGIFAFLARKMGYVRVFDNYFLVATPFFRFKTSFKRVRDIRTAEFHRVFDLEGLRWAEDQYTGPLIGKTAVVVRLKSYPVSERILRMFFQHYMFSPQETELVLLVDDWMALSLEFDSRYTMYQQRVAQLARRRSLRG